MESIADRLKAALESGGSLALVDPAWPAEWKKQLAGAADAFIAGDKPGILIPTSGTTGLPKYCIHTVNTLNCAAKGYAKRFGEEGIIHSVNVLPQHHVGGLMPFVRSAECSGMVHCADYADPAAIRSAPFPLEESSISVVPTQLRRMMVHKESLDTLRSFALILVGGAACAPDLLDKARESGLRLCPCYGATETAAMVTALTPDEFLAGSTGVGTAMPHAGVVIDADGHVLVRSDSVTLGYLPVRKEFCRDPFPTGDIGHINAKGHLHIHGRADRVIITGGEKVHPEQVESAALMTGLVQSARCLGVIDPEWGMRVELEVTSISRESHLKSKLLEELKERLPKYAVPKVVHRLADLPAGQLN